MGRKVWLLSVLVVSLLLVTSALPVLAIDGQSTTPDQALSYIFQQVANFTPSTKVVVAVANSTDYNIIALADLVARHEGAPLLITPKTMLSPETVEVIQQLMKNAGVTEAIVVGVGSNASTIADLISKISIPGENLTVQRIIAPDVYNLSVRVALAEFTSSSSAVVCDGNLMEDIAKGLMIAVTDDIPLLYEQVPFEELNTTLKLLGVSTVYTTPAVDTVTEVSLTNAGYTVNTSWRAEDLTKNLDVLLADTQPAKNATIVVGSVGDFIRCASVMGVNSSILLVNSTTELGVNVTNYLSTNKPALVIVMGDQNSVSDQDVIQIAAATGKKVERLFYDNFVTMVDRLGLLEEGYIYPVIVLEKIEQTKDGRFKYMFRNIGFSDAVRYGDYAVRVEFTKTRGKFVECEPSPIFQNNTTVIFYYTKQVVPYDTFTITFATTPGTEFEYYPKITYNAITLAGAVISISSYIDYLIQKVTQLKDWIVGIFQKVFGSIKAYIPLPSPIATVIAAVVLFLILWTIIGGVVYVVKVYILKKRVESTTLYGPVGWLLGRR